MQQKPLQQLSIFKIPLANYYDNDKCVLDEVHKKLYLFLCPLCRVTSF